MKVEKQVCSLKLAKRLKELGVKQESLWYYVAQAQYADDEEVDPIWVLRSDKQSCKMERYSAFTVAEFGEMLPSAIKLNGISSAVLTGKMKNGTCFCGLYSSVEKAQAEYSALTEADARAKMLIYLLENKLINKS